MMQSIESGNCYWVELENVRLKFQAVEEVADMPGWWRCEAPLGSVIILHEPHFVEECQDDPTSLNWMDAS